MNCKRQSGSKKGFIFSVIAISFMMLLILLATTMANEYWESERVTSAPVPNVYAAASLDNIGILFADTLLPDSSVTTTNVSSVVYIADYLPRQSNSSQISGLKTFAEGSLANSMHAQISVNTTQVQSSALSVSLMDNYFFESTMNNNSTMVFRSAENASSTNATQYNITFSVSDFRTSVSDFSYSGNGSMNVTIIYSDKNGTASTSGSLNPNAANHFVIDYVSGKADIIIGRVDRGSSHHNGALMMNLTNESATYSFTAEVPVPSKDASSLIVFPIPMTYTQGGITKMVNASK